MVARRPTLRPALLGVLLVLLVASGAAVDAAPAVADAGSGSGSRSGSWAPVTSDGFPEVPPGTYAPPVDAPVSDPFRLEHGPYGAGNRGLEYATSRGQPVRAVAAGRVAFAGPVAGRPVVSIDHPDGRRSSLTGLATISVGVGDLVARGTVVGTAGATLHLGLREGRRYVDPAGFFGRPHRRAILVPVGGTDR